MLRTCLSFLKSADSFLKVPHRSAGCDLQAPNKLCLSQQQKKRKVAMFISSFPFLFILFGWRYLFFLIEQPVCQSLLLLLLLLLFLSVQDDQRTSSSPTSTFFFAFSLFSSALSFSSGKALVTLPIILGAMSPEYHYEQCEQPAWMSVAVAVRKVAGRRVRSGRGEKKKK